MFDGSHCINMIRSNLISINLKKVMKKQFILFVYGARGSTVLIYSKIKACTHENKVSNIESRLLDTARS